MEPESATLDTLKGQLDQLIFLAQVCAWGIPFFTGVYVWRTIILWKNQSSLF